MYMSNYSIIWPWKTILLWSYKLDWISWWYGPVFGLCDEHSSAKINVFHGLAGYYTGWNCVLQVQYCDATSQVCCRLPAGPNEPSVCGSYGSGGNCGGNLPASLSPSQPGIVHVTPSPSQSGLIHITPSSNQPPSAGNIKPGDGLSYVPYFPRPSFPASGVQHPSASIPSATYAPGNNFGQPIPGSNGVPIGGSIYDTDRHPVTPATNQSPYTGPLNTTPHPGCAAALKCVPESYCTAEGVMADQPVILTRDQYENRVPLSVSDCHAVYVEHSTVGSPWTYIVIYCPKIIACLVLLLWSSNGQGVELDKYLRGEDTRNVYKGLVENFLL